jgi:hypothetical protein
MVQTGKAFDNLPEPACGPWRLANLPIFFTVS